MSNFYDFNAKNDNLISDMLSNMLLLIFLQYFNDLIKSNKIMLSLINASIKEKSHHIFL